MRKIISIFAITAILFYSSCTKNSTTPQSRVNSKSVDKGTGQDNGSGVDATTGYLEITKHMVDVVDNMGRHSLVWDGRYETNWYNYHLWVQIETYHTSTKLGDPVYAILTPDNTAVSIASNGSYVGGGYTTFVMTIPQFLVTDTYSATAVSTYDSQLKDFFNGTISEAPLPPGSLASASIKTVYGKVIKINTGSGFALAEIKWTAPTLFFPYKVNQASPSLTPTITTANGIETITVVDNKTIAGYTPTITFKLNSSHLLTQMNGHYDATCTYSTPSGITWSQSPELFPNQQLNTTTHTISFGLEGHFTGTNISSEPLAIWITYNYVTHIITAISYNDSAYLYYYQNTAQ